MFVYEDNLRYEWIYKEDFIKLFKEEGFDVSVASKEEEKNGIDLFLKKNGTKKSVQLKLMKPRSWKHKGTLYIEMINTARPSGKGWFFEYKNLDLLIFGWTYVKQFYNKTRKIYKFNLYNYKQFRLTLKKLIKNYEFKKNVHYQSRYGKKTYTKGILVPDNLIPGIKCVYVIDIYKDKTKKIANFIKL